VSSTDCGTQQLCAAEPSSCDPSTAGSCFFLAAKRQSGQNFEFALAGESEGYLAATLSTDSTLVRRERHDLHLCKQKQRRAVLWRSSQRRPAGSERG
ncbi:putative ferric-chelate reductase 1, partial [Nibea albiflora]